MSLENTRAAAVKAILAVDGIDTWELAWDNALYNPEAKPFWTRASVLMGEGQPVTLGSNGEDNFNGTIQLLLHQAINTGEALTLAKTDILRKHFAVGASFLHEDSAIVISRNGPRPGYHSETWWIVPFLVTFYSRINRN